MAGSASRPRGPGVFGTTLLRGLTSQSPENTEGGDVRGPQKCLLPYLTVEFNLVVIVPDHR